jgi:glycosyltransferase involved in cell wall biosynthesis
MKILLESRAFHPSVGGLEMMSRGLASAWQGAGHAIRIVTITPLDGHSELENLSVLRSPSPNAMRRHVQWADVFVQSGVSLRSLHWPLLTATPLVIIHHNLLAGGQDTDVRAWLKRRATHLGINVAVSSPVASTVPGPVLRIPNAFNPMFDQPNVGDVDRDGLLFVGRLVSTKGVDVALQALKRLRNRGTDVWLTICGDGPERNALEREAARNDIAERVRFEGWTDPHELVHRYRSAELLLLPSTYESFGITALEAIASGCPVVASNTGGLPEAVGECGLLAPPDDPVALAEAIERALRKDVRRDLRSAMSAHVDRHRIDRIATDYLHLLRQVVPDG